MVDRKELCFKQIERNLEPLGSYRVENIEAKYWKESLIQLRSGYPAESVDSLMYWQVLILKTQLFLENGLYYLAGQENKLLMLGKTFI